MEIGYRLRKSAWGRGLATEAATELVRRAMADPAVTGVVATAVVLNRGSIRVMEKAGLAYVREFMLPGIERLHGPGRGLRPFARRLLPQ